MRRHVQRQSSPGGYQDPEARPYFSEQSYLSQGERPAADQRVSKKSKAHVSHIITSYSIKENALVAGKQSKQVSSKNSLP
jgi:hypothetical protein